jgi:molybdate transport system substrate-binding protein
MRKFVASAVALFATGCLTTANAADIKLLTAVAVRSAVDVILPDFERTSGQKVTTIYGSAASLKTRIDGGETFDLAILTRTQVDDLAKNGKALMGADLARSVMGFAIRAGAPRPDISTDEKLVAFLLDVKSIAHGDPALNPVALVYFDKMPAVMRIAEALKAKTIIGKPGEFPMLVAKGEAEIGLGMSSEIAPVTGVEFVALRPDDPATSVPFAVALATGAKDDGAARAFLAAIQTPAAKEVFKSKGMVP